MLDLKREADQLEAAAFQLRQWCRPLLDAATAMEESAVRLKRAGRPGPVEEITPPLPAA